MNKNETTEAIYTVSQLASLCGISRSGILRLQEEGLLIPSMQNAKGDKRLYSFLDLMKLCQIVTLHNYGFTHRTIQEFFNDNGNYTDLISLLAARQTQLFHFLNAMRVRMTEVSELEIEYVYAPEIICHTKKHFMCFPYYDLHREIVHSQLDDIIRKKYRISTERPLFLTTPWEGLAEGSSFDDEREFTAHIPLNEMPDCHDPDVVVNPKKRMMSMLIRGPHIPMSEVIDRIKSEISMNDLTVNGPLYLVSLIGPHLGQDIPPERYLARVMLPVTR